MLRYSCDVCGKDLIPGEDRRYVVKIEVEAAHEPGELTEDDLDADAVESLGQMLADAGDDADFSGQLPPVRKDFRFDLCPECHEHYVRNPLARETVWQFSNN
jgi:hypothetical protein